MTEIWITDSLQYYGVSLCVVEFVGTITEVALICNYSYTLTALFVWNIRLQRRQVLIALN